MRSVEIFNAGTSGAYSPRLVIRKLRQKQLRAPVTPNRSLVVCTNPRSGSWMLCTALARSGLGGYPSEYLIPWDAPDWTRLWKSDGAAGFLDAMLTEGTSANGVFGVKVMFGHMDHLLTLARAVPGCADLSAITLFPAVFPDPRYVWLRRRDMVRQAVSHARAVRSGVWAVGAEGAPGAHGADSPPCDVAMVRRLLAEAVDRDARWEMLFAEMGVTPLVLWYEDMVAEFPETVQTVLRHAGVTESVTTEMIRPDMVPQADATTERWVAICRDQLDVAGMSHD